MSVGTLINLHAFHSKRATNTHFVESNKCDIMDHQILILFNSNEELRSSRYLNVGPIKYVNR